MPLASTQRELTPLQRFVYFLAKDAHTPDDMKQKPTGYNSGRNIANQF